jgi:hypothetical protein
MFAKVLTECNVEAACRRFADLEQSISRAAREGTAAHVVELDLFRQVLALGAELFGEFLKLSGTGDKGPTATLDNGQTVKRLEPRDRRLVSVFGVFTFPRSVYGTREGQKIEWVPTDQRLQLPESEVSYLLQNWSQMLDVEQAFGTVAELLKEIFQLEPSVDTLEQGSRHMARTASAFRAAQPAPDPKAEGELLVASEDNKGVPMVRPVRSTPAGAHRKKGEKANKKQMATLGCVYTVDRQVRTAGELVAALFRDPDYERREQPKACQKRYWAALTREVAGRIVRGQDEVFEQMADDIELRRRPGQTLIHLSDGQHSLEDDRKRYLPQDWQTVDILDLLHVAPRLWEAAHLFHREGSDQATAFVRERMLRVLQGQAKGVIMGLRRMGTQQELRGAQATRLGTLCDFLESNLHRMRYDQYLLFGYPIATGVIEGACRHIVKDRMERAGMRWKVPGAQAMLELRVICTNGDWKPFQTFRIEQETKRLYPRSQLPVEIPEATMAA